MKKHTVFAILLALVLLFSACGSKEAEVAPTAAPATQAPVEATPVAITTPVPTEEPTPAPTEAPTPMPTATPVPRDPKEGDIAVNFPNYDTGAAMDADYSYQSDEIRVAIKKYVDEENVLAYHVADIWIRNVNYLRSVYGNGGFGKGTEEVESFSKRVGAIVSVDGTYNIGMTLENGNLRKNIDTKDKRNGIIFLYADGSMKTFTVYEQPVKAKEEMENGAIFGWQFGPVLVHEGKGREGLPEFSTRHPRCIIGYYEPGHYCLVLVDGRDANYSIGMTEKEMVDLMVDLGCTEAMNLDGGTSAVMCFMGETINQRSGKGDRKMKDMIVIGQYDAEGTPTSLEELQQNAFVKGRN